MFLVVEADVKAWVGKVIVSLLPWTNGIWHNNCKNRRVKTVHNIGEERNLRIDIARWPVSCRSGRSLDGSVFVVLLWWWLASVVG